MRTSIWQYMSSVQALFVPFPVEVPHVPHVQSRQANIVEWLKVRDQGVNTSDSTTDRAHISNSLSDFVLSFLLGHFSCQHREL